MSRFYLHAYILVLTFISKDMHDLMVKPLPPGCRLTVRLTGDYITNSYLTSALLYKALFDASFSEASSFVSR